MTTYPRSQRLKKTFQFKRAQNKGVHHKGRYLVVCAYFNSSTASPKFGVVASKHFGNAIQRNRFKRLSREAFRHIKMHLPAGVEMVVKPRRHALSASMKHILQELSHIAAEGLNKN